MYMKTINEHGEPIEQELDALDVFVRCAGCGMEFPFQTGWTGLQKTATNHLPQKCIVTGAVS